MSQLTGPVLAEYQSLFTSSTTAGGPNGGLKLGAKAYSGDGREFRFCLAGAADLVPGKMFQASVEVTTTEIMAVAAAAAIGATSVTVTLGITNAVTANQYAGGFLVIAVTPGQGYQYEIASHPAAAAGASCVVTLADPILIALTTASKASFVANPYTSVIVCPVTLTSAPVGVPVFAVTAAQYGWLQVGGTANVLNAGGTAVGNMVVPSTTVAGAVKTAASTLPTVGFAIQTLTDTDYGPVWLTLG